MRVGLHEAIHAVGSDPSSMNSGTQHGATVCAVVGGLWNR